MPARTLVIGYGSPIRGDDAIGPMAADQLQQMNLPDWLTVESRHILTAELAADLADAERVVFLDAAVGLPPGELRRQRLFPDKTAPSTMAHFHDPRELLAWCEALYDKAPDAWLITAGGDDFGYGHFRLSKQAGIALHRMLEATLDLIGLETPDLHQEMTAHESQA